MVRRFNQYIADMTMNQPVLSGENHNGISEEAYTHAAGGQVHALLGGLLVATSTSSTEI